MTSPSACAELRAILRPIAATAAYPDLSRYRTEPVLYARERLGLTFLPHQSALAYAVANQWHRITPDMAELAQMRNPGKRKIAVSSGQKTGKTLEIVALALWFFDCFAGARALMTAAIGDQIRAVIWRELNSVLRNATARPSGLASEDPARGFISSDGTREIRGFTGRKVEALAGFSGNLVYFIDEASHLEQKKAEAIEGNTAGEGDLGAPIVYTSQPTRNDGPFFDAFHHKSDHWTTMVFDSERIADHIERHGLQVAGLATRARVRSWMDEYGEDSPFYQVRARGAFLLNETGRVIPMHVIEVARARWAEAPDDGELAIGFDPAGPGDGGDEHGFAVVRGNRCAELYARRGLSEDQSLAELYALIAKHRRLDEPVRIMIDAEGNIGSAFYGRLRAESEHRRMHDPGRSFAVYGIRTSSRYVRDATKFARVRDEVWWTLSQWMLTGAIPCDHKLEAELYAPIWIPLPDGRIRATPKIELRDFLGRSTDRADALALAVDPPRIARADASTAAHVPPGDPNAWAYAGTDDGPAGGASEDANAWAYGG